MRLTDRIFKWGLIIILIVSVGTMVFINNHKLEEPIIVKTYGDWYLGLSNDSDDSYVSLPGEIMMISNSEEEIYIASLSLIDAQGREYSVIPHLQDFGSNSGRYKTKSLLLEVYFHDIPFEENETLIKQFKIGYGDGKESLIDVGEITIYKDESEENFLMHEGTGSNGFGEQSSNNRVTQDFTIEEIELMQFGKFNDGFEIYINNIPLKDIVHKEFKVGDILNVETRRKNENSNSTQMSIAPAPKLIIKDSAGKTHEIFTNLNTQSMYDFRYLDLIEYVKFLEER